MIASKSSLNGWERDPERERSYTRQNKTRAKGSCISTLLISLESHQSEWPFTKFAPPPTRP